MISRKLIYIPTYNCEKTIASVINGIKNICRDNFILVVDDSSKDRTFEISKKLADHVIRNQKRLGYGGNQKVAFRFFVENSFDKILMIHGDGQHNPVHIPKFFKSIDDDSVGLIIGSRMSDKLSAIRGGMPYIKFIVNIFLTYLENKTLGLNLSEFHSGYRCYSFKAAQTIYNFIDKLSNDFIFDQQVIFLLTEFGFKIKEIPVETIYNKYSSHIGMFSGMKYFFQVILHCIKFSFNNKNKKNFIRRLAKNPCKIQ